jgi:hypothetical protein
MGALTDVTIEGNDLSDNGTGPLSLGGALTRVLIANNKGIDDVIGSVASGATVAAPLNPTFEVTGTTTITKITGGWVGREIGLIFTNAAPGGVATGGSGAGRIAKTQTVTQNQVLPLVFDGTYWYPSGGGAGGGGGALSVQIDGGLVGTRDTLNLVPGAGITLTGSDTGTKINVQPSVDTATIPTKANLQSATNPTICTSASGSGTAYTATCALTLAAYATKQTLFWWADMDNVGADPTLNIDTLGPKTIKNHAGTALSATQIKASTLYRIWYDGTYIRVVEAGLAGGSTFDPLAVSPVYFFDEFYASKVSSHNPAGQLMWEESYTTNPPAMSTVRGTANHYGIYRITTGAVDNDDGAILLGGWASERAMAAADLTGASGWEVKAILALGSTANIRARFGFDNFSTSTSGIYLEYDTDAADTKWMCVTNLAGSATRTDTTAAASTGWATLRIWSDVAGTIKCSVNGTATAGQATNLPTAALTPGFIVTTRTTAAKVLDIDAFWMKYVATR